MIAVLDYGAGNLHSIVRALERQGLAVWVLDGPAALDDADAVVVPGDGAFGPAMQQFQARGFVDPVRRLVKSGRPFLGVCLGMQLLFEESDEDGRHPGLALLPGRVTRLSGGIKVPHMGWNALTPRASSPLLDGCRAGEYVYFIHSYRAVPADPDVVAAVADYGGEVAAVVGRGNLWATQFHPEKSGRVGVRMLENFARWVSRAGAAGN